MSAVEVEIPGYGIGGRAPVTLTLVHAVALLLAVGSLAAEIGRAHV